MEKKDVLRSASKKIAYIAVMTALLIGGQLALGFVAGIEVVTVLLLCFSCTFGVVCGMLTAVAFSLLRCFLWGFYPTVVILYLIYYPLFALCFGLLGKIKDCTFDRAHVALAVTVNLILLALASLCICCVQFDLVKISRLYKATLRVFLWVIAGLCLGLDVCFNVFYVLVKTKVLKSGKLLKLFFMTAVASVCTVCFSLLDDVITPLFLGMDNSGALVYFYGSFLAMLPQTVCTIVTVSTLFYPLTAIMKKLS